MDTYQGRCHCGQVAFEVQTDLGGVFRCNCSYCVRRAAIMQMVDGPKFTLKSDESVLGCYGNRDFSKHYFCRNCGINCFTRIAREPEGSVAINVGCLEGVDSYSLTPSIFDGANKL